MNYIYKLVKLDLSEEVAEKTVFYLSIFPTAYFLSAVYTEALFLALVISAFYYSQRDKWLLTGLLGSMASLTRIIGIFIFLVFYYYGISILYKKKFSLKGMKPDILWLGLIPLGFCIYLWINYTTYNNFFAFLDIQKVYWFKRLSFPWNGFLGAVAGLFWRLPAEKIMVSLMEIIFAFLGLVCSFLVFKIKFSYGIYSLINWIFFTSTAFWLSIPRYTLTIFPIFIIFALWGQKRYYFHCFFTVFSCILLTLFTIQFVLLF